MEQLKNKMLVIQNIEKNHKCFFLKYKEISIRERNIILFMYAVILFYF